MMTVVLADRFWDNDLPLGEMMVAFVVGLAAAIALLPATVFARRDSSLKRGFRILLGVAAFDIFALPVAALLCTTWANADRAGRKPEDLVREFISAVESNNYQNAASFLTKQSVNAIEHNSAHEYDFHNYCAHFKSLESYTLSSCRRGKGGYWNLRMSGLRNGEAVGYWFFFDRADETWFIVENDTIPYFSDEPEEGETQASLRILSYRDLSTDRNKFPERPGLSDTTVLVHRIGHDRAIPSHPIMAEAGGSYLCRIRPGTHIIEYEEIKGRLENQLISYSSVTQVFEAGRAYVLEQYSIKDDTGARIR